MPTLNDIRKEYERDLACDPASETQTHESAVLKYDVETKRFTGKIKRICYLCASQLMGFNHNQVTARDWGVCDVCGEKKAVYSPKIFNLRFK